ncbi:6285_t:CDS:2, partial [Scutellospora calospora]
DITSVKIIIPSISSMEEPDDQDIDFEELSAYDSLDNFLILIRKFANTKDTLELFVSKTFQNWSHVENFMKDYASAKESSGPSCRVGCLWKINIWVKKNKNCLEVTTFNNQHTASGEEDTGMLLRWLHDKKIEDPR